MTLIPAERFPVGEYISDEIEARGWTVRQCAENMAVNPLDQSEVDVWNCTLDLSIANIPDVRMDQRTADALARAFGTDSQTWLNLDAAYRYQQESN